MPTQNEKDTLQIKLSRVQKLIGRRMLQSKQTQPCFYLNAKADITEITKTRRPLSKQLGTRITTNDFYISAIARAVEKFPLMAGTFKTDYIKIADEINIGLAVASPAGLIVPVVKQANKKSLVDIAKATAELISKAKSGKLTLDDLEGGCITLTALGMFGIESFLAIPSPGQAAIVSIGKINETVVPLGSDVIVRKQIEISLAVDHRIVDGSYAAKFLSSIAEALENPSALIS